MRSILSSPRILFALIFLLALALRAPGLNLRPMHGDEAVHAIKFGALLEAGDYRYDPFEYHGPTLNYFSLLPAWLRAHGKLAQVDDATLRLVPVCFGLVLILLLLLLIKGMSWPVVLVAACFTAISPAMTFYSRYYIQEMLLVCFTFGVMVCGYRYVQQPRWHWVLLFGLFVGLMHATKETFILALGAMFVALLALFFMPSRLPKNVRMVTWSHALAAFAVAMSVSALFFSSFFNHLRGIIDSILTYETYLKRAGDNGWHLHPWYTYFKWLLYTNYENRPLWSEAFLVVLAVIGIGVALRARDLKLGDPALLRFLALYTIIMTIVYALIPYKTPWNLLGFYHGMILLAAYATVWLLQKPQRRVLQIGIATLLVLGTVQLTWQSYQSNFKYHSDGSNPYVYAHPTTAVFTIVERMREVARAHPEGRDMYVQIISPLDDYWPLPWYLRDFPNIGWWNHVDTLALAAPVILAAPQVERELIHKLYEMPPPGERELYVPLFDDYLELRHGVEMRGYITRALWERWQESLQE